jgi:ADP-ribosylglycohydrolase
MKIAPIAAFIAAFYLKNRYDLEKPLTVLTEEWINFWNKTIKDVYDYTLMTHNSSMALESAFAQIYGIVHCLLYAEKVPFNINIFLKQIIDGAKFGSELKFGDNLFNDGSEATLYSRLIELKNDFEADKLNDTDYIIKKYAGAGKSTGYILNSIPFSYAFFLRNPHSIDAMYDVVNAGGDTDTNAAIIGPMLGALNGTKIIPQHLLDGLKVREEVERLADEFCDAFGIDD